MAYSPDLIPTYTALFTMAVAPIIIGSFISKSKPKSAETLSRNDIYMFPIIGSAVLFSLYLAFKFLSKDWLNFILQIYFAIISVGAVFKTINPFISTIVPYQWTKALQREVTLPLSTITNYLFEVKTVLITFSRIISFIISVIVGASYFFSKHWIINNIIGESFSITSIELIRLGSFANGAILLIALFFYDIFWVFGTDVMVTVAKSFDAPIKVLWPRRDGFSLLGLGDIVIPGIFIAQMLRFDEYLRLKSNPKHTNIYFWTCVAGYIGGLLATIIVLTIFEHGQPALLYLVPGCLGSVTVLALLRGDLKELIFFSEEEKEVKKE